MGTPLLIHIPHSSVFIPDDDRKEILLNDSGLRQELLKLTDRYTGELFDFPGAVIHKNLYSRIVFDPERFRSDKDEMMSQFGMGAIYTRTEDGKLMKNISNERRESLLQKYYDPYHSALNEKTRNLLELYGRCLIIDGHSFPETPLSFELDKNPDRPDICIGTDDFHTQGELIACAENYIKENRMTVKRNFPFAGTMVPMKYYQKDNRVCSIMIEVNRKLYMDETTGEKLPGFETVNAFIRNLINEMLRE